MSVTTARTVRRPLLTFRVFQLTVQPPAALVSVPMLVPSTKNATWRTPTSSVASAVIVARSSSTASARGRVMSTDGFWSTVTDTAALVPVAPAASVALAVTVWRPLLALVVSQTRFHPPALLVSVPIVTPSTRKSTRLTALSSVATTLMVVDPDTSALAIGLLIRAVGAWLLLTTNATGDEVEVLLDPSVALAVTECDPFSKVVMPTVASYR